MTTSPIISITDELIAELEMAADYAANQIIRSHGWEGTVDEFADGMLVADERYMRWADPTTIKALLAERSELIKDAARLEKLAVHMRFFYGRHDAGAWEFPEVVIKSTREQCTADHLRAAIDSMVDDNE